MRSSAVAPDANLVSDQRADERFTTLFRVARVVVEDGGQHLCLIRNIGAGGLMLETYAPFDTGTAVRVEPKGSPPVSGKICWVKDKNAGVILDTFAGCAIACVIVRDRHRSTTASMRRRPGGMRPQTP